MRVCYELESGTARLPRHDRRVDALQEESRCVIRKIYQFFMALCDSRQQFLKHLEEGFMGYLTAAFEATIGPKSSHTIQLEWSVTTAMSILETHFGFVQSSIEEMIVTGLPGAVHDELTFDSSGPSGTWFVVANKVILVLFSIRCWLLCPCVTGGSILLFWYQVSVCDVVVFCLSRPHSASAVPFWWVVFSLGKYVPN